MKIISFDLDYEIQREIKPNPNKPYQKLLHVQKKGDPMKRNYVAAIFEIHRDNSQLVNRFYYLKTLKIFNILQQVNFYHEADRFILVFLNFEEYQLDEKKLQAMSKEQKKQILLQLSLTFTELVQRKAPFNLTTINQLYYIEGFVFISMMDYNYYNPATDFSSLGCFKQFVTQNFDVKEIQEIDSFDVGAQTFGSFTESILYAYELMDQDPLQAQYFKAFRYIFQILQYKQLAAFNANSHIYKFTKPLVLTKIIDFKITAEVIAKSSKIVGAENVEEVKNNVQTEIELMEKFEKDHRFAACYKYLRILDQSYLFMQYYCMNLRQYFELIELKPHVYFSKLIVYNISYQFIRGLRFLHMAGIYHRDLKPENLFLTDEFIQKGEVHIADFDRSKQTIITRTPLRQIDDPTDNTPEYSPVEGMEAEDYTIDMWQFGLIIYEIANMGVYPGKRIIIEFDTVYGPNIIENKLKQHDYDQEFVKIIQRCLSEKPKDRPEARALEEPLKMIYQMELKKQPIGPKLCYSESFKKSNMFQINNKQMNQEVDEQS